MRIHELTKTAALSVSLICLVFGTLLAEDMKSANEAVKRGKAFLEDKQIDKAIAAFSEAIKLDPNVS
jgi:tetratricopeptide (TPR) repeat protein